MVTANPDGAENFDPAADTLPSTTTFSMVKVGTMSSWAATLPRAIGNMAQNQRDDDLRPRPAALNSFDNGSHDVITLRNIVFRPKPENADKFRSMAADHGRPAPESPRRRQTSKGRQQFAQTTLTGNQHATVKETLHANRA